MVTKGRLHNSTRSYVMHTQAHQLTACRRFLVDRGQPRCRHLVHRLTPALPHAQHPHRGIRHSLDWTLLAAQGTKLVFQEFGFRFRFRFRVPNLHPVSASEYRKLKTGCRPGILLHPLDLCSFPDRMDLFVAAATGTALPKSGISFRKWTEIRARDGIYLHHLAIAKPEPEILPSLIRSLKPEPEVFYDLG